jgi:uncharacterized membrane protein YjgN (DUF898 family)
LQQNLARAVASRCRLLLLRIRIADGVAHSRIRVTARQHVVRNRIRVTDRRRVILRVTHRHRLFIVVPVCIVRCFSTGITIGTIRRVVIKLTLTPKQPEK